MKALIFLTLLLSIFLFTSCKKDSEVTPKDYPYVITNNPVVTKNGVTISANLVSSGNQNILRYGFIWSTNTKPTTSDNHHFFETSPKKGEYSFHIKSALEKGKTYQVRAYFQTDQYEIFGNIENFESSGSQPPVINNFSPEFGPIGTHVTIQGENFSNSITENSVKIGNVTATVIRASENEIEVMIPKLSEPETGNVTITIAGMSATSKKTFELWFPWLQKSNFPGEYLYGSSSFSIGNCIYICGGLNFIFLDPQKTFWEYNTVTDVWTQKPDFPGVARQGAISFSCNGKGYFGMGSKNSTYVYYSDLWEYNPSTEQWTNKTTYPGTPVVESKAFVVNNKAYMGVGTYWKDSWNHFVNDFWEYDPVLNTWTKKKSFPGSEQQCYVAIGTNDRGYLGAGSSGWPQRELFEYDPENDTWQLAGVYPGKGNYDIASFYIHDKLYLGLGQNSSSHAESDFWEFNPANRTWKAMNSLPITFAPDHSQTVNNKGYVFYGWHGDYTYGSEPKGKKIFEFDPTKN